MTGPYEEFDGIVMAIRKHKEQDALIKIFTKEHGKRMFFVRNYAKPNHAMKKALLPFTHASYIGRIQESGLCFLQDYRSAENFPELQVDPYRNAYATYLANLSDAAVEDGVVNEPLYGLLLSCCQALNGETDPEIITHIFEMHALPYFGIHPRLDACVICGNRQEPFDYSARHTGVLCARHWPEDEHRLHLAPAAVHFCRIFQHITPEQVRSISLKEETKVEIRRFVDFFYDEYVGIRLKSKAYIEEMRQWEEKWQLPQRRGKDGEGDSPLSRPDPEK